MVNLGSTRTAGLQRRTWERWRKGKYTQTKLYLVVLVAQRQRLLPVMTPIQWCSSRWSPRFSLRNVRDHWLIKHTGGFYHQNKVVVPRWPLADGTGIGIALVPCSLSQLSSIGSCLLREKRIIWMEYVPMLVTYSHLSISLSLYFPLKAFFCSEAFLNNFIELKIFNTIFLKTGRCAFLIKHLPLCSCGFLNFLNSH